MIYKTFEQWMNGDFLEVGEPRKKAYSKDELLLVEMGWNYGYDAGRAVEQALDKKAENARELGLDYEPATEESSAIHPAVPDHSDELTIAYMSGVHRGKELAVAQAVPDAFGTREGEHPQYIEGWNDCRAEMLKGMKP